MTIKVSQKSGCNPVVTEIPTGTWFSGVISWSLTSEICLKISDGLAFVPGREYPIFNLVAAQNYVGLSPEIIITCKFDKWVKVSRLDIGDAFLIAGKPFIYIGDDRAYAFHKKCLVRIKSTLMVNPADLEIEI